MKTVTYSKETEIERKTETSYTVGYCRLTVIDATRICNKALFKDLLEAFQLDILEWRLNRLRREHKRLETNVEYGENYVTVRITKRPLFKR